MLKLNQAGAPADRQPSSRESSEGTSDAVGGEKPMPGFVGAGTSASEGSREKTIPGTDRKLEKKFWKPKRIMSVGSGRGICGTGALYGHFWRP